MGENSFDSVIHAAAVSDFSVASIETGQGGLSVGVDAKLSSADNMTLHLQRNPKLLNRLRRWSKNPGVWVLGFKLTHSEREHDRLAAVEKLFATANVDAVVHNDLTEIDAETHPFHLHRSSTESVFCADSGELAERIALLMEKTW